MILTLRTIASRLLTLAAACAPTKFAEWARAMLGELDFVEDDWSAFFWALGSIGALLRFSTMQLLLIPKWRDKSMIRHTGQVLLGAVVAGIVCVAGSLVYLASLKVAGLQLSDIQMSQRLIFISLLEVTYVVIAAAQWRRRKFVSVGVSLAGLTQLASVIWTVSLFMH
ncbi:MAG TPA: hypothetical protein VNY56_01670 [Methylomirabilota bacterium]|jgi:hypothetical protein|nr:hypothetical protein [Methylomirabilota bacterium]